MSETKYTLEQYEAAYGWLDRPVDIEIEADHLAEFLAAREAEAYRRGMVEGKRVMRELAVQAVELHSEGSVVTLGAIRSISIEADHD